MHRTLTILIVTILLAVGCGPTVSPVEEISVDSSGVAIRDSQVPAGIGSDWPWWRGPSGNGLAADQALPTSWSASSNIIWRSEVPGRGHGSPIVCGNQVFLATADEVNQKQSVVAYDRSTGQRQWETTVSEGGFPGVSQMHPKGTHANGTLACDGTHVFAALLAHDCITAFALDLAGNQVWTQKVCDFNSKFGYAPSPLIYKSTVIFAADNQGGGCLAALDRATGEVAWRKARPAVATYSSPIVTSVAGRDQLLISGCNQLVSYDPNSGEEIWSCDGIAEATCGTAVWADDLVFASGGFPESETIGVRADGSGEKVWSNSARLYEPSMIVFEDHIYGVSDKGIAYCFAAATGEEKWKQRLGGGFSASPVICNGLIYVSSDRGTTHVIRCNPEQFESVAENQLGSDTYASPAVCGGQIFLRVGENGSGGRQEALYCIGLTAGEQTLENVSTD